MNINKSTIHGLDVDVATKYGIEEALIISNFQFWLNKNFSDGVNMHDGHVWTYNTSASLAKLFPYMPVRAVRYAIDNLVKQGVLIKACYNKAAYDRTTWYAFSNETEWLYAARSHLTKTANGVDENGTSHLTKTANGVDEIVTPIPDSKQQIVNNIVNTFKERAIAQSVKKFIIPELHEITQHISDKNYSIDAESFLAFYTSNGWMVGKNKMKCWKSAMVTWAKRPQYSQPSNSKPQKTFSTPIGWGNTYNGAIESTATVINTQKPINWGAK